MKKKESKIKISHNYMELFNQIEQDIKMKLPDKSRANIAAFVGWRHAELKEEEEKEKIDAK